MMWEDIDRTYPAIEVPVVLADSWQFQWLVYVDALLTYFARAGAGLDVGSMDRDAAREALRWAHARNRKPRAREGDDEEYEYGRGVCALLAAALADTELVATCTGKRLGSKVQPAKQFGTAQHGVELRGLARHLATAAHAKLPARQVTTALVPLRDGFVAGTLRDPRVALVAAYVQLKHVAMLPADELREACRAWIEGRSLASFERSPSYGIADGHDPRVMIFEQFAESLANPAQHWMYARDLEATTPAVETSDRSVFHPKATSNAAVYLYLARQSLAPGWSSRVDPYVARWLGADVSDASIQHRRLELLAEHRESKRPRMLRFNVRVFKNTLVPAIAALHFEDLDALVAYTGGGKLTPFKPGMSFRDDWRKLLRYLGGAVVSKHATPSDVEPAWLDFLSRQRTEWWFWSHLLAVQAVITVQIGHRDPVTVGRELQLVLTGV